MDRTNKMSIAQQLAKEFGMSGEKQMDTSRYDKTTGTLYVGSRVYRYDDIRKARDFFSEQKTKMLNLGDAAAGFYEISELAISQMLQNSLESGGRIIVKDSEQEQKN